MEEGEERRRDKRKKRKEGRRVCTSSGMCSFAGSMFARSPLHIIKSTLQKQ